MKTRDIIQQYKNRENIATKVRNSKQISVIGESMLPCLDRQKYKVLLLSDVESYHVGDIVVFENDKSLVGLSVHRIISLKKDFIITKGDNNNFQDHPIDRTKIIGRIEKALDNNGKIVTIAQSKFIASISLYEAQINRITMGIFSKYIHRLVKFIYRRS